MHINDILFGIKTNTSSTASGTKPELIQGEGKSRINHAASLKDSGGNPCYNHSFKQGDTPFAGRFSEVIEAIAAIVEEVSDGNEDMAYSAKKLLQPKPQHSAEYQAIKAKYQKGSTDQASTQQGKSRPGTASNKTGKVSFDLDKTFENIDNFFQSHPHPAAKLSNQTAGKERPLTVDDILPIDDDIPGPSTHSEKKERPIMIEGDIVRIDTNDTVGDQLIKARHFQKLSIANELAQEVLDKISTLADSGKIELGSTDKYDIAQLRTALDGLNKLKPYALEGKDHSKLDQYKDISPDNRDLTIASDYLSMHQTCTTTLAELATRFSSELLPVMDDLEQLGVLSSAVIKALDVECARMVKTTMQLLGDNDPASKNAKDYSVSTRDSITNNSNDAIMEAQVQKDVLNILNSAITEYSQQKLDSHRNSFFKAIDFFGNMDAEAYGKKLEIELEKNFGPFFDINVIRDESISVSLKKGALGSLPSGEFLQILNSARDSLENEYDKETIKDAVNFSTDVELTSTNGKEQIAFTEKEKTRLTEVHASADVAPLDKLRNNIAQAGEQITVATVKSTLLSLIEKDVKNQIGKLGNSIYPSNLRIDKFELIENLTSDLVKSNSTQEMLDRVNQAIGDHDKRLQKNLVKRFNHDSGVTGKILESMAAVLKVFDSGNSNSNSNSNCNR
ncbi:MAG: hypothetical protein P8Y45_19165 [Exilibacterium sp.]